MFANIKKILKCLREYKKPTILCLIFIIGEVVMEVLIPYITSYLVNRIKAGEGLAGILSTGLLMVLAALASLAFGVLAGKHSAFASAGLAANVRHDMYVKIQDFSFANIDKFSTSSLVTRMTTDITNVQNAYMMCIRIAVRAPVMFIFAIVMGIIMGGRLATTFMVIIPVLFFGLFIIGRLAMPAFRSVFRKYDRLNESVEENVRGMRVVKGFAREEYEAKKFETASDDIRRDFTKAERIVGLNGPIMQMCLYFNLTFVLFVGSQMIIKSHGVEIDVGQISAMITYGFQILMSLMMINMIYIVLTMSVESIKRIAEVLSETPTIANPENAVTKMNDGSIEFKNVSFRYFATAKRDALHDINIKIGSGMTVGVLGGTGSGKTSLIQLIPRLYDATEGEVLVGGRPVTEYDLKFLRDNVSAVLQKNELFSGTIRENLMWGNENATDDEIREAARLACADEFINSFPDGYDTHIEQGGTNVSGGQKQRLCIARALLKHPKILILDDSTSAVDTHTDAIIRKGFKEFIPETTKIIIAQRVASVMDADLILIMDGGRLVASGKHDELLGSCDIYREIYEQQTRGGDEE